MLFFFFNCIEADLNEIRPILPQLLDGRWMYNKLSVLVPLLFGLVSGFNWQKIHTEFFKLMNEIENEDLVFTLETIVEKFGEEMAPYALGLCQHLVI